MGQKPKVSAGHRVGMLVPVLLLVGLTLACCSTTPPTPTAAETPAEQAVADPAECTELDELSCLDSADCTLRQAEDTSYFCTAAASDCERGFLQHAGRREDCAAGCSFSPAHCYCSPDVTCICGGGPPSICQAAG